MADASPNGPNYSKTSSVMLSNSETEKPSITVSAIQRGNEWFFSVKDNGIGIAPEFMEHIFKMFQREHASTEYPGTGVGLAICKEDC